MNNCTFVGRLGQDADLRYTGGGDAVCSVNIAIDRRGKKDGEKQEPLWIRATFWRKFAESLAPHLKKGSMVSVSGAIDLDEWEGRDGGIKTQIVIRSVQNFSFCGSKRDSDGGEPAQRPAPRGGSPEISDEDIPF